MIPFSPPRIDQKIADEVVAALYSGWITTGPRTKQFEEKLAEYIGTDHVVCLNSATAGLQLILNWLGIGPGDEVIVPAYTYCATANVVIHRGATPVMVDVNSNDFNINTDRLKQAITNKTKAIIAVDLAGLPADYQNIKNIISAAEVIDLYLPSNEIQKKLGRIMLIADAAHSIGATSNNINSGLLADMTSFSFHAVKNLTTAEGGAVCFNLAPLFDHAELQKKFKISSLHGQTKDALSKTQIGSWQYDIIEAGFKCNMTDIHAAIGLIELERYSETLNKRKEIFEAYSDHLKQYEWAELPLYTTSTRQSSFHLYQLRIKNISEIQRNQIITLIGSREVAVNVHYLPLPMLSYYKNLGYKMADFPVAYDNYSREITLPVYYNLTEENISTILRALVESVEQVIKQK